MSGEKKIKKYKNSLQRKFPSLKTRKKMIPVFLQARSEGEK